NALLVAAAAAADAGHTAEDVLWILWSGTPWPERLRSAAESGGGAAARANRDLDSLCALFETAARVEERRDHGSVQNFLAGLSAQRIPADTLAEHGVRGSAVRLLTAHRSKGLEWQLVVVAHVQAGGWPDLRRRSTLLQADRIGSSPYGTPLLQPPVTSQALLAEERRLFYVACTRARRRLVVTAVASPEDDGDQPSRFLDELDADQLDIEVTSVVGRPARPLSLAGVVAELRRTVSDETASPAIRAAAARRLARLVRESHAGRALVPQADPGTWWGTRAASWSAEPVRPVDRSVSVSASMLESVMTCPAQWFLSREAGGVTASHQAANVGNLVHALAERVASGELTSGPEDVEILIDEIGKVWDRLQFRTPWSRAREYARVRAALARFLAWHYDNPRTLVGVEQRFTAEVALPDGTWVVLHGYADRLELDADGAVVVVDLKTGRGMPTGPAVQKNLQLALYQYAVENGAVDAVVGAALGTPSEAVRCGGAELLQLGQEDDSAAPVVQLQEPATPESEAREVLTAGLRRTADLVRSENFPAVIGSHCERCDFVPVCPVKSAGSVVR
ncbi:MAG: PD-(D/E)XK nuclease family protein, partial [Marmoricola sp.]